MKPRRSTKKQNHNRLQHTSSTLGTDRISEKANKKGWKVASTTTFDRAEPLRLDAFFTKTCFCKFAGKSYTNSPPRRRSHVKPGTTPHRQGWWPGHARNYSITGNDIRWGQNHKGPFSTCMHRLSQFQSPSTGKFGINKDDECKGK
ncbi:root FNR 2, partial [Striga asiatica]